MSSIKESSLGLNYGWSYGETGWNSGMDENIVLTGFHANKQVKGILSTPPTTGVNNGDAYIVGSSPTGTWVDKYAKVAIYDRGSWLFATPSTGVSVYNKANGCWYEYNNGWSLKSEAEESPYIKVKDFDFSTGYTITDSRQLLFYPTNQTYYQWNGALPKVVPTGSTPETTGGIGAGAWVDRSDVTLRSELADINGAGMIGGLIAKDTTIYVPSDYSTIGNALDFLRTKTIVTGATVTIRVADGNYVLTSGINGNHPNGDRIRLIGNQAAPSDCVITISGLATFNAFTVSNGNVFGFLDGFRFDQPSKSVLAQNFSAVIAMNGATINCGPHIETNNWYYGINSSYNSTIICDYAKVTNAGDVGIWAFCGSFINARYAQSNNCSDTVNGWGFGFQAEYGSTVNCEGATATGNNIAGFAALSGSTVRALSSNSSANVGSGYFVREGGVIEAWNSTASNNARYGIELLDGTGWIFGPSGSGNALGSANKFAYLDVSTGSARVTNSSGNLRIDNSGNYGVFFHTAGGLQFAIDHVLNAVNSFHASGSIAGVGLTISAQGADTNIAAYLAAKGAGVAGLTSNGKVAFQVYSASASNVNYLQADSSLTGIGAMLSAQGADTNIDLKLNPKGAGYLQINAGYTASALSPTGYISIKDDTGTVRRLLVG